MKKINLFNNKKLNRFMIIGVVSLARGGKDTFADFLVQNYGFKKVNTSDSIHNILKEKGLKLTKDNLSIIADQWRKETKDMAIVTKKSLENITNPKNLVICGFRSIEEVEYMKKIFPSSILVAIMADKEKRFERKKTNDPQDKESFFRRDKRDIIKKGLSKVLADADYFLLNNNSLKNFYKDISNFLNTIKKD